MGDISSHQCRAARALISWSQERLAEASLVAKKTIADFEREAASPRPRTILALANALKAAGIEFIPENGGGAGVRMRKAGEHASE